MYGINSEPPKNCLYCPLCQGEYGPGNEKSYCVIKPKVKLKYKGYRPKECPIIKVRLQEEITNDDIQQAIKEGYANGYEMTKEKFSPKKGEWIISQTMDCHSDIINIYTCPFCGNKEYSAYPYCHCGADMRKGGAE